MRSIRVGRRGGTKFFTLLELLIVIAIIALLASLLLPVLKNARRSAHTITCANNFQQLGKAILMYADDNGEFLPPYRNSTWGTPGYKDLISADSKGLLEDYLKLNTSYIALATSSTRSKLTCPAITTFLPSSYNYSHGYNYYSFYDGQWSYKSVKLAEFITPSKNCLLADANDFMIRPDSMAGYPIDYYRHATGMNILWGDFHVAWENQGNIPKTDCNNSFWLAKY